MSLPNVSVFPMIIFYMKMEKGMNRSWIRASLAAAALLKA